MDADLQDPPDVLHQLVERWTAGAQVVYAVAETARRGRSAGSPTSRSTD